MERAIARSIPRMRTLQERLMTESAIVRRNDVIIPWPRTGATVVPCRFGEERTFAEPSDPHDANVRSQAEWAITMPWDFPLQVADYIFPQGPQWSGIFLSVGETNNPQTWLIATRGYITKQKTAVHEHTITIHRRDYDTGVVTEVGTYAVKIVFARVDPVEVPTRFSFVAGASWRQVTLIFEDQVDVPVKSGDTFIHDGYYGFISTIIPGQHQRTEAIGYMDFGGTR